MYQALIAMYIGAFCAAVVRGAVHLTRRFSAAASSKFAALMGSAGLSAPVDRCRRSLGVQVLRQTQGCALYTQRYGNRLTATRVMVLARPLQIGPRAQF